MSVTKQKTKGEKLLDNAIGRESHLLALRASYYLFAEGNRDMGMAALRGERITPAAGQKGIEHWENQAKYSQLISVGRMPGVARIFEELSDKDAKRLILTAARLVDRKGDIKMKTILDDPAFKAAAEKFTPGVKEPFGNLLGLYLRDQPDALREAGGVKPDNPELPRYRD